MTTKMLAITGSISLAMWALAIYMSRRALLWRVGFYPTHTGWGPRYGFVDICRKRWGKELPEKQP
jgi:hypothetical protein